MTNLTAEQNLAANKMRKILIEESDRLGMENLRELAKDLGNQSLLKLAEILSKAGRAAR